MILNGCLGRVAMDLPLIGRVSVVMRIVIKTRDSDQASLLFINLSCLNSQVRSCSSKLKGSHSLHWTQH